MTNIVVLFIVLSVINVIASTARSIITIKGGKFAASASSAGYFAFYNIMLIYTVAEFPMWQKCLITFMCNLIGVYIVKFFEELMTKDKMWEIRMTIRRKWAEMLHRDLKALNIPHNYFDISDKHTVFNVYCATQNESSLVKDFVKKYNAKYFVSEGKTL